MREEIMREPLVTISRPAWKELIALSLASDVERGGYAIGKRTWAGYRVTALMESLAKERSSSGIEITDDYAKRVEPTIPEIYAPCERIGYWHTHPWKEMSSDAIMPQITDDDKRTTADGEIEIICPTFARPDDFSLKPNEYIVQRVVGEMVCRVEAWLRKGKEFKPCLVKVR